MKIIESIIANETISTNRIKGYLPSIAGTNYNFTASITPNSIYSACTAMNETNPIYEIRFPYDTFYAEKLIYTIKGTRYPKSIKIQGINEKNQFIDVASNLTQNFCSSKGPENDCAENTLTTIEIPVQLYKGFKISLIGKDNRDSTQLCVGQIEIEGLIVHLPSKIEKCFKINYIYIFLFICFIH